MHMFLNIFSAVPIWKSMSALYSIAAMLWCRDFCFHEKLQLSCHFSNVSSLSPSFISEEKIYKFKKYYFLQAWILRRYIFARFLKRHVSTQHLHSACCDGIQRDAISTLIITWLSPLRKSKDVTDVCSLSFEMRLGWEGSVAEGGARLNSRKASTLSPQMPRKFWRIVFTR